MICCKWKLEPKKEITLQIGREEIILGTDELTIIDTECSVFGPVHSLFPLSVTACTLCLINNKVSSINYSIIIIHPVN